MSRYYAEATDDWVPDPPAREDVRPHEQEFYDRVLYRLSEINVSSPGRYFGTMLYSPTVCYAHRELGSFYRSRGDYGESYTHAQREWVDIVLGKEIGWHFSTHIADALAHGIRAEAIRAVYEGNEEEVLNAEERQLAEYIRAVFQGRVTAELFKALENLMGTRGAVEYTGFICFLFLTARCTQAFGTPPRTEKEFLDILDDYASGRVPLPDGHDRVPGLEVPVFAPTGVPLPPTG